MGGSGERGSNPRPQLWEGCFRGQGYFLFSPLFCLVNFTANRSRADAFVGAILREMTESKSHLEARGSLLAGPHGRMGFALAIQLLGFRQSRTSHGVGTL
jgi:hypothetical protein